MTTEAVAGALAADEPTNGPAKSRGRGKLILRRFLRNRLALVGAALLLALLFSAYVLPSLLKWQYTDNDWNFLGTAPGQGGHLLGTNHSGQDMLAVTLRGLQKSLIIGLIGGPLTTFIAAVVGAAAGYFGGWIDRILMWGLELLLVVPGFLLLATISPKLAHVSWLIFVLLLAALGWMITARVVRSMTLTLKDREYVLAARYMGVGPMRIIFRHILPNMASLLIVDAAVQIGLIVLGETSLSYFGFGIQAPDISLGTLISQGEPDAITSPWMFFVPAGFLVLIGLCSAFIGDGLRDAFDPSAAGAKAKVKLPADESDDQQVEIVSNTVRAEEGLAS